MKRKIYRENILQAGQEIMFLNGYNATGIKEITNKVNIPKGSFYNHFSSKEEFGLEMLQNYCDSGVAMYQTALIDSDLNSIERLDAFFNKLIKLYKEECNCKLGCIMSNFSVELADTNEKFRTILDTEFNECEAIIVECLKQAQAEGSVSENMDCSLIGSFLLNSWHGAIVRMKSTGTTKPLDDFKSTVFSKLLI